MIVATASNVILAEVAHLLGEGVQQHFQVFHARELPHHRIGQGIEGNVSVSVCGGGDHGGRCLGYSSLERVSLSPKDLR